MASIVNYGLKALVNATRSCAVPGCTCKLDQELMRKRVNDRLDPSHQLDEAAFNAICLDLDQNPVTDDPKIISGEKQRDDGNFDRVVEEAFKKYLSNKSLMQEFRNHEREITLNAPEGSCVGCQVSSGSDDRSDKFWIGATHLRHHLEFLLVLKGIKPCVLFFKFTPDNDPIFSTVVIDCLVTIMDRFDLWSYGFSITTQSGLWVFYDARAPKMHLINKVFLTHPTVKQMDPVTYPSDAFPGVPDEEVAEALGYPVTFNDWLSGKWVSIRDATELEVLNSIGRPQDQYAVQGIEFTCPVRGGSVWMKVLDFYHQCVEGARSVGTKLTLFTGECDEMTIWLSENPGMLDAPVEFLGPGEPTLNEIIEFRDSLDEKEVAEILEL